MWLITKILLLLKLRDPETLGRDDDDDNDDDGLMMEWGEMQKMIVEQTSLT